MISLLLGIICVVIFSMIMFVIHPILGVLSIVLFIVVPIVAALNTTKRKK